MAISRKEVLEYQWLGRDEGYTALEQEVIFRDLCSGCGNCEAVCPEDVIRVGEYPELVGKCTDCGYCLMECPRAFFDPEESEEYLLGENSEDLIGHFERKVGVKTKDSKLSEKVQDGGFVTTFLKYALKKGLIDGAVVSGVKEKWLPEAKLVTKPEDLDVTGGTRYTNSPNLSALKEAREKGLKKIALVGVPCQIEAARKLELYPIEDVGLKDRIKYTIAIFCSSNFMYRGLMEEIIEKDYGIKLEDVKKLDIKGKNLHVFTEDKKIDVPLKEAYKTRREGCKVCTDFSGRLADFSCGSVGAPQGYTTVLPRTKEASSLLDEILEEGLFEEVEIKEEKPGIELARSLQAKKEKNARKVIRKKIRGELPLPFKNMRF